MRPSLHPKPLFVFFMHAPFMSWQSCSTASRRGILDAQYTTCIRMIRSNSPKVHRYCISRLSHYARQRSFSLSVTETISHNAHIHETHGVGFRRCFAYTSSILFLFSSSYSYAPWCFLSSILYEHPPQAFCFYRFQ